MKKQLNESDFIGGQGPLTKKEEAALTQYFKRKKSEKKKTYATAGKSKSRKIVTL